MSVIIFFFFNDTATTEIYTLSLHDALPISVTAVAPGMIAGDLGANMVYGPYLAHSVTFAPPKGGEPDPKGTTERALADRKSTRLNSSHAISRMPSSA